MTLDTDRIFEDLWNLTEDKTRKQIAKEIGVSPAIFVRLADGVNDFRISTYIKLVKYLDKPFDHYIKK